MPLINCEIELDLRWERNCIITEISRPFRAVDPNADPGVNELTSQTTFQINNAKLYVPVVTLSSDDNIRFLENIKLGFKKTISWSNNNRENTKQCK